MLWHQVFQTLCNVRKHMDVVLGVLFQALATFLLLLTLVLIKHILFVEINENLVETCVHFLV